MNCRTVSLWRDVIFYLFPDWILSAELCDEPHPCSGTGGYIGLRAGDGGADDIGKGCISYCETSAGTVLFLGVCADCNTFDWKSRNVDECGLLRKGA